MGNNRRERQKKHKKEERLDSKNAFGISDRTPKEAIDNMIRKEKSYETK